MSMRRVRAALFVIVALLVSLLVAAGPASASTFWAGPDPRSNIALSPDPLRSQACFDNPFGASCTAVIVKALDHARSVLGKPAYALPSRFAALTGPQKLLVLSNDDRRTYGLSSIRGLNRTLNRSAGNGVATDRDPSFVDVAGHSPYSGTSNWAGGGPGSPYANPALAYYEWMYYDGYGSGNYECTQRGASGCWGHRHDTLWRFGSSHAVYLGAAGGLDHSRQWYTWTELYEAFGQTVTIRTVPSITAMSPHTGPSSGGTTVTVHGFGFRAIKSITVCGVGARRISTGATRLLVAIPRRAGSTHCHLVVTTTGGSSPRTAVNAFTYG